VGAHEADLREITRSDNRRGIVESTQEGYARPLTLAVGRGERS